MSDYGWWALALLCLMVLVTIGLKLLALALWFYLIYQIYKAVDSE